VWGALLAHYREEDALVEGPLTNLKGSMVQLGRQRRVFDAGLFGLGGALSTRFRPVEKAGERHEGHGPNNNEHREEGEAVVYLFIVFTSTAFVHAPTER